MYPFSSHFGLVLLFLEGHFKFSNFTLTNLISIRILVVYKGINHTPMSSQEIELVYNHFDKDLFLIVLNFKEGLMYFIINNMNFNWTNFLWTTIQMFWYMSIVLVVDYKINKCIKCITIVRNRNVHHNPSIKASISCDEISLTNIPASSPG